MDLLTILCGKRKCLSAWLDYIATIPFHLHCDATWIIIDNSGDPEYAELLKSGIESRKLVEKFKNIVNVDGPGKFVPPPGRDWRESDVCVGKHRSTGESFTLGFSLCKSDIVYTLDDDTIPPPDAFKKLLSVIMQQDVGAAAGLYFNHMGWNTENPWRTTEELKRTVVASIREDHWHPAMIDDYWGRGVVDSGFVGTGITMWKRDIVYKCLPLETIIKESTILGPDGYLCQKIREFGLRVCVESSVLCEHLDDRGGFAGIGVDRFMQNLTATSQVMMICSFGNLDDQLESFRIARRLCELTDTKMIQCWPRNADGVPSECPWITDHTIAEVKYFDYNQYRSKFHMLNHELWILKKMSDLLYYEMVNSGKYGEIYNLMQTTHNVPVHISELKKTYTEFERLIVTDRGLLFKDGVKENII